MDVSGIGLSAGSAASDIASSKLADNFDTFLQLLTAQLQNQDPLEPLDSKDFVNQLVQFSGVEQAIETNRSLEKLLDFQNANQTTAALGYIGNKVEVSGDTAPLENGKAEYSYTLPESTAGTLVVILDAAGQAVFSTAGETTTGRHDFVWDGTKNDGSTAAPGNYRIRVSAQNAAGAPVEATTTASGSVTGIATDETGVLLDIGGASVPIASVQAVRGANPSGQP